MKKIVCSIFILVTLFACNTPQEIKTSDTDSIAHPMHTDSMLMGDSMKRIGQ